MKKWNKKENVFILLYIIERETEESFELIKTTSLKTCKVMLLCTLIWQFICFFRSKIDTAGFLLLIKNAKIPMDKYAFLATFCAIHLMANLSFSFSTANGHSKQFANRVEQNNIFR